MDEQREPGREPKETVAQRGDAQLGDGMGLGARAAKCANCQTAHRFTVRRMLGPLASPPRSARHSPLWADPNIQMCSARLPARQPTSLRRICSFFFLRSLLYFLSDVPWTHKVMVGLVPKGPELGTRGPLALCTHASPSASAHSARVHSPVHVLLPSYYS